MQDSYWLMYSAQFDFYDKLLHMFTFTIWTLLSLALMFLINQKFKCFLYFTRVLCSSLD